MPQPRVLILRAPGTNCDRETAFAFEQAGGRVDAVHVNQLLENPRLAGQAQILCLPGGFSYGDDLGAGRILANQIRHHLYDALNEFKAAGKLLLGVCNGFQVLIKAGVLLADVHGEPPATLTGNDSGKFEDRWVRLKVASDKSVFLRGVASMYLPIAHAEGKFVARDEATLRRLEENGQLVLRYASTSGTGKVEYPDNPNGSQWDVAGVCDETGRVLGLMPHPERHIDPTHHPRWTRGEGNDPADGVAIFQNAIQFFR